MELGKKNCEKKWCGSYGELSTSKHSQGRHCANSCRNSSLLADDAALFFGRMVGYTYTHLQKRRRVEKNLSLQKSVVSQVLSVEQEDLFRMCLFTCE